MEFENWVCVYSVAKIEEGFEKFFLVIEEKLQVSKVLFFTQSQRSTTKSVVHYEAVQRLHCFCLPITNTTNAFCIYWSNQLYVGPKKDL